MKTNRATIGWLVLPALLLTLELQPSIAHAQGTAFTYQGRLNDGANPAGGIYDLRFTIYDSTNSPGALIAGPLTNTATAVSNGLFTVTLDFGPGVFSGAARWLDVAVRTNGTTAFTALTPRQALTPAPYAVYSANAGSASNLLGALPSAQLAGTYANALNFSNAGDTFAGSFTGNGANVTNVNAAALGGMNASGFWQLGGNAVTKGQFLGSTNNCALEIRADNAPALRLECDNDVDHSNVVNIVGGSPRNSITPGVYGSIIAGGGADYTSPGGMGGSNTVSADLVFLGGGWGNAADANAFASVLGGGEFNAIQTEAYDCFVGGGYDNVIQPSAGYAVLAGGEDNRIQTSASDSFLGGGWNNSIQAGSSVIVGGAGNSIQINAYNSVIGGGANNQIQTNAANAFIGGGDSNLIQPDSDDAILAGGSDNLIQTNAPYTFLGGGADNSIQSGAEGAFLGGGENNAIQDTAFYAVLDGGFYNTILTNANRSVLGGGAYNIAGGSYSVIPGGWQNSTGGRYSFAAGQRAKAPYDGDFVWADSQNADFTAAGTNQFLIRAAGGVGINTNNPQSALHVNGTVTAAAFSGSGAGLASLNTTNLLGTFPASRLNGTVANAQLANSSITVSAGTGLSGGGTVALGGSATLNNAGVLSVTGNADITASPTTGNVVLGTTATSAATPNAIVKRDATASFSATNLTLNGNLNVPATTAGAGIIYSGGSPFIHAYGYENFFAGTSAGNLTTTGYGYNTGVGDHALNLNTSGEGNSGFGRNALYHNTTGNFNTAVGINALNYNSTGNTNIAVGNLAGVNVVSNLNIDIGNPGMATDNGVIRIGTPGLHTQTFIAGTISADGGGLTNLNASQLAGGTIPLAQLPTAVVTNNETGLNLSGTFSGNGVGITNVNVVSLNTAGLLSWPGNFLFNSSPAVGSHPQCVVAADVNGDGKPDLISANSGTNTLTVLTNNGSGGFVLSATLTVGIAPIWVVAVDVNGDGKLDLISANSGTNTLTVLTNNGSGGFVLSATLTVGSHPQCVVAADVNGDGKLEFISANSGTNTLTVLTNNGSGVFGSNATLTVGSHPQCVVAADVNGDGKLDLISANLGNGSLSVLTNNGSGVFGSSATLMLPGAVTGVVAADVNGDGKLDLITDDAADLSLTVLTNNGSGGFVESTILMVGNYPNYFMAADVNGDGKVDLISANFDDATLTVLTNNGTGGFGLASLPTVGYGPACVVAADVNGDGSLDLVSANFYDNTLSTLFNVPTVQGNFSGSFSGSGSGLTGLNASQLTTGTVPFAQLPSAVVTNNETGVTLSGTFSGNGSGLTSLNASSLVSGTVPLAQITGSRGDQLRTQRDGEHIHRQWFHLRHQYDLRGCQCVEHRRAQARLDLRRQRQHRRHLVQTHQRHGPIRPGFLYRQHHPHERQQ